MEPLSHVLENPGVQQTNRRHPNLQSGPLSLRGCAAEAGTPAHRSTPIASVASSRPFSHDFLRSGRRPTPQHCAGVAHKRTCTFGHGPWQSPQSSPPWPPCHPPCHRSIPPTPVRTGVKPLKRDALILRRFFCPNPSPSTECLGPSWKCIHPRLSHGTDVPIPEFGSGG